MMVMRPTRADHPVRQIRDEMDRLFNDFFPATRSAFDGARAYPALNVWESEDHLYCEAEVPGLTQNQLEISLLGNELTIRGQRTDGNVEQAAFHRRERNLQGFERTVRLPIDVEGDQVDAILRDGVLLLSLPKAKAAKPRKIVVKGE